MAMAIASQPGRASYARRMGVFSLVPLLARTTRSSLLLWERATTLVVTALPIGCRLPRWLMHFVRSRL